MLRDYLFILDEQGNPQSVTDSIQWSDWFANLNNRILVKTQVNNVEVSTIFLGINHNWSMNGKPILWETMVFGGDLDQFQQRYSSKDEALAGHEQTVNLVKKEFEG